MKYLALLGCCLTFSFSVFAAVPQPSYWSMWDRSDEANVQQIDHGLWDDLLVRFADPSVEEGIVTYRYMSMAASDIKQLKKYTKTMSKLDPRKFSRLEQKAYWMNVYNALSVQAVLENLDTLQASGYTAPLPADAWAKTRIKIAKEKLSLNDISHRILRPIWHDHRVLFGLNCASRDCPNFAPRAYTAANIKEQLVQAGDRFIDQGIGVEYQDGTLSASRLFQDYMGDFAEDEKSLKKVFAHYARDMKALYFLGYRGVIQYRRDSRLNLPQ
jgi:Protein of unknown function, DUF547